MEFLLIFMLSFFCVVCLTALFLLHRKLKKILLIVEDTHTIMPVLPFILEELSKVYLKTLDLDNKISRIKFSEHKFPDESTNREALFLFKNPYIPSDCFEKLLREDIQCKQEQKIAPEPPAGEAAPAVEKSLSEEDLLKEFQDIKKDLKKHLY